MTDKTPPAPPSADNCQEGTKPSFAFDNKNIVGGKYAPPPLCIGTVDYSTSDCAINDSKYLASLMAEQLNMAAGPVNIFPLLGVHSQGSTIDQTGSGFALSSGTPAGFDVLDAFNVNDAAWHSIQQGSDVVDAPAYIGYDFGTKKAWDLIVPAVDRERYFPSEPVRKKISTFKIIQGEDKASRASQVRVEASDDGVTWKRVDVVNIPDSDTMVVVKVNANAMYNKWRLIPTFFNGVAANSPWEVVELQLLEETQVSLENIEDFMLLENRDRAYCRTSTMLKCAYDLMDVQTELARFGINLPQTYIFTCSYAMMIMTLGRPVVVGDICEVPGEAQYDPNLRPVRKWVEVTDCAWSTDGYTPDWKPQLFKFYAQPILPSVEHRDILGVPGQVNATQTDSELLTDGLLQNQQAYEANEAIKQASADAVPQDGQDPADIMSGKPLIKPRSKYDGNDLYVEDALPPNGENYTTGDSLPDVSTIADGHYHRLTYTNVASSIRPPDKLVRWFAGIQRWRVVEVNTRFKPESNKRTMAKIMGSANSKPIDEIQ